MDVTFDCERCGQHIAIDESGVGVGVKCPTCGHPLVVPPPRPRILSIPPPAPKVATPTGVDTNVTGKGKRKGKAKNIVVATSFVVGLILILFLGRSVTRGDRSPLGKTEQQVGRLYGEPVKIEGSQRTYLLGDITAVVDFFTYGGSTTAESAFFYRDSPVGLFPNRITMQEAQRLMRELSGGGRWTIEQDDSKHRKYGETRYVYRENSLRLIYRKLRYVTVKELNASYNDDGMLFVSGRTFGDAFSFRDAFAAEPSSHPLSSNELAALEAQIETPETNTAAAEEKPTALDVKGGFREYRLGMKRADVPGDLTKEHSFTEDAEEYAVVSFDHALGAFQIDNIKLEFGRSLGILKEVRVWIKGKQNVEGVLEAFKVAYGEPEAGGLADRDYSWHGADLELRYSVEVMFDTTATATWTSKKVEKMLEDDRQHRAKEGAADAAKGL